MSWNAAPHFCFEDLVKEANFELAIIHTSCCNAFSGLPTTKNDLNVNIQIELILLRISKDECWQR